MTAKYETVFALSVKTYADEEALNAAVEKFKKLMRQKFLAIAGKEEV